MRRKQITRRQFLRSSAAAGIGLMVLPNASLAKTFAANEAVSIGLVGVGGRGGWFCDLLPRTPGMDLAALCDVDEHKAGPMFEKFDKLPRFNDYRVMLDKMGDSIDAVIVATPDNTHAVVSAAAIKAGKGVYTEKPLTLNVYESHVLRKLAREHKVATQMGNQGTSSGALREAAAHIQAGTIGEVREAFVWMDGGGGGAARVNRTDVPVPATLHWDLWLGPAAYRPYHPQWMQWGGWRDLGSGNLGGWGSHSANLPFNAMKCCLLWQADPKTKPIITIRGEASEVSADRYPSWWTNRWEFPAHDGQKPFVLHWITQNSPAFAEVKQKMLDAGVELNERSQPSYQNIGSFHTGCFIPGTKGTIVASSHNMGYKLLLADKNAPAPLKPDIPRSLGHERDWAEAVKGGQPAASNYDYSSALNETLMLGNASTLVPGEDLKYDPLACKITNNEKANAALRREYREGWTL